ncbi:MAG TPA: hypothetical protein VII47_10655, partial [Actinomycetota bacterium]
MRVSGSLIGGVIIVLAAVGAVVLTGSWLVLGAAVLVAVGMTALVTRTVYAAIDQPPVVNDGRKTTGSRARLNRRAGPGRR